jgi:hypothetical protein
VDGTRIRFLPMLVKLEAIMAMQKKGHNQSGKE